MQTEAPFFARLETVKRIVTSGTPTAEALGELKPLLNDAAIQIQFFEMLSGPSWLKPLEGMGLFRRPPSAEVVSGGVKYPRWPPGKYLVRVAKESPKAVAEILGEIKTDNASVVNDILDAALAMPPMHAATLVPKIGNAIKSGAAWLSLREASDLCARLASGNQADAALVLADSLFTPPKKKDDRHRPRRDEYWYNEGLKKVVPALAQAKPKEFARKLVDWLRALVESQKPHGNDDHSYVWRPAIEDHEQNRDYELAATMVGFVRDALEQGIRNNKMALDAALALLDAERFMVFKRLRIHLINAFADRDPDLARRTMLDYSLFDSLELKHEYAMLVGARLPMLLPEERDEWLGWIETGPDMSQFDEWVRDRVGREATEEDRQARKDNWRFNRLHWIREHLDGYWKTFYENMLAKQGMPELSDLNFRIGTGRWGHETPFSVDDLKKLPFADAVRKVTEWEPAESRPFGPDPEGVASTFSQYLATSPEEFSQQAQLLEGRHPIFVRRFIERMSEAIKEGKAIDLAKVLELCEWVVEQDVAQQFSSKEEAEPLEDKDWQWTRNSISRLIKVICDAKIEDRPRYTLERYRDTLGALLQALIRDSTTSNVLEDLEEKDPRTYDYLTIAINSPRGNAVEALLDYARWVGGHVKRKQGDREIVPGGFRNMPEVREMLDWLIAPGNASVQGHAAIGSRMNALWWLDAEWLSKAADSIFDFTVIDPPRAYGWAAWNAFVVWVHPHIEYYKLFRKQFTHAVEHSAKVSVTDKGDERNPMLRLGEHLLLLYGRGQLALDQDDTLLRRFLTTTPREIRVHAMQFVGSSLRGGENEPKLPNDITDRFVALWEWYWPLLGRDDVKDNPRSMMFGSWFACGQFDDEWSLEQLWDFVQVVPMAEPDDIIVDRLAAIAHTNVGLATKIIDHMARHDTDGWRVYGWRDHAYEIVKLAMHQEGEVRVEGQRLIDFLGRRGFLEFGNLLD